MKYIKLSEKDRQTVGQMYEFHSKSQIRERCYGLLLSNEGYSMGLISDKMNRHYQSIRNWIISFEKEGVKGLFNKKGRGRKPKLTSKECKTVCAIIEKEPRRIGEHLTEIQKQTAKLLSHSTIRRLLKKAGYSWRRMRRSLKGKRDEKDFQEFKSRLENLKDLEDKGLIELYFCDESGFSTVPVVPYHWQKIGEQFTLPSSKSKRYNVLGFMKRDSSVQTYGFQGSIDSKCAIACMDDFCEQRLKRFNGKAPQAYVIIDNAPIHNSKAFIAKEEDWLQKGVIILRLPPYSPELNYIEILWRKIKYEWLPLDSYESYEILVKKVNYVIDNIGKNFIINFG